MRALITVYHVLKSTRLRNPFPGKERIPTRHGRICHHITAEEVAALLEMSRATFFRKAKAEPRFRDNLGFTATNARNGRYSLEAVLYEGIRPYFKLRVPATKKNARGGGFSIQELQRVAVHAVQPSPSRVRRELRDLLASANRRDLPEQERVLSAARALEVLATILDPL